MKSFENITIGADPELFIINEKTKKVVSSIGLIPGIKGDPYVGEDMPSGFGLETDNILAEFNIPPVRDEISFINNIEYMKNYIDKFVKDKNPDLGILCAASMNVPESELNSPEAKEFGCSVDYNVYTQSENPKPQGASTNLRSAGFHIHYGYCGNNIGKSLKLIKYMDLYLGLPSVILDTDNKRRTLYGKAGCFRLTSYGFEYRVLSSYMMSSTDLLEKVWEGISRATYAESHCMRLPLSSSIQTAINKGDKNLAEDLIKQYKITV